MLIAAPKVPTPHTRLYQGYFEPDRLMRMMPEEIFSQAEWNLQKLDILCSATSETGVGLSTEHASFPVAIMGSAYTQVCRNSCGSRSTQKHMLLTWDPLILYEHFVGEGHDAGSFIIVDMRSIGTGCGSVHVHVCILQIVATSHMARHFMDDRYSYSFVPWVMKF